MVKLEARDNMAQSLLGIDIGMDNVKIVHRDHGLNFVTRRLPENVVNDEGVVSPQVMAEFLKTLRAEEGIRARDCSLVLAERGAFFRHVSLPPMSVSELKINLPFEFRDYISEDPEGYAFDYALDNMVEDEEGKPTRMELFAAAARKETLNTYAEILKRAGFRLKVACPAPMANMHLMHAHNVEHPEDAGRDIVVVDIGYNQMNISLFEDDRFMGSRVVDSGCVDVDSAIAEMRDVDLHVAGTYRDSNFEGVLDTDRCRSVFDRLVFEVSKVVNFYNFSNPDKDIKGIYLSGGGAAIPQLVSAMGMDFDYPVWYVNAFMPDEVRTRADNIVCSLAYAALVAGEEASRGA
jgi:type IV pilus assembly protein PilM